MAIDPTDVQRRRYVAVLVLASAVVIGNAAQSPPVNPQARALKDFADRTQAYMELHAKVGKEVRPLEPGATSEAIAQHSRALADALRAARRSAREGDIFTAEVAPQFRRIIRRDLRARDLDEAFAAIQEVPIAVSLHVNQDWPADAARATVPPRLLKSLYPLPPDLEYRFIDRHLVLLDIDAHIIVDIVRDVVPSSLRRRH
jgi:hypothetical protein